MNWLFEMPIATLTVLALLLALAPFAPEPHLVEKIRMLAHGELRKPIDIFDLCWHSSGLILLAIRLIRDARQ
ncbi:MAG: RND transporter [Candidatus Dadabacteria bacterium]|nr:MAG: RND transporter [Candidatus Dadabacteria bacterium]